MEQEEEYITNKLMKRLEQLKKEKQALATEVSCVLRQLSDARTAAPPQAYTREQLMYVCTRHQRMCL